MLIVIKLAKCAHVVRLFELNLITADSIHELKLVIMPYYQVSL
jgi:hypothetical protein